MKRCYIQLKGCDDSTFFHIDLYDGNVHILRTIQKLSKKASTYGCQPVFLVKRVKERK